MENATGVYFISSSSARAHDMPVCVANFRRCLALFAARKLVTGTWINDKDEYLAPDETRAGYDQWVDDAHVYALAHPSNNCTAMREVDYADRKWQISNHLFWQTRAESLAALDDAATPAIYRDCKQHPAGYVVPRIDGAEREPWEIAGDPYFASVVSSLSLSPEAVDVLARLRALWAVSLSAREAFAAERPELHLLAWDAGVYQLKHLWRAYFPEQWEALRTAQRALADRLRPGVYSFGFLLQ